jgi:O-antigen ligase
MTLVATPRRHKSSGSVPASGTLPRPKPSPWQARLLWLPVAWGVVLFGGVYAWAYIPMLAAAAAIGVYGWTSARPRHRAPVRGVAFALAVVAAVVAIQLIPLPAAWLARVSPATDAIARQYDLQYAAAPANGGAAWHAVSIAPAATAQGLAMFVALSVFLAGATAMMPRVRVPWLIRRVAALGLAIALFGIIQRGTFNNRIYWVWTPINTPGNAFGPFVNRNHFAGWMLMAAALTAGYICALLVEHGPRRQLSWRQRLASLSSSDANRASFAACALAVMALSIVWTLSRSGIVAFAIATMLLAADVSTRFRGRRRIATVLFLLIVVAFAVSWKGIDTVYDWFSHTSTLEWRFDLWRDTMAIVRDFPWLGTGLNTYGLSTLVYPMTDRTRHAVEAHSDYVQLLSEGGIVLSLAAALVLLQLARAIRAAFAEPQTPSLYWVRTGATIGLVAIGIQELTDFSLQMPGNAVLFALLAAVAMHRPPRHARPALSGGGPASNGLPSAAGRPSAEAARSIG